MVYFRRILIGYSRIKDLNCEVTNKVKEEARILQNPIIPSEIDVCCIEDTVVIEKMYDLAISVGGDGSFLRMVHLLSPYNTPIIGVNLGRRGFMPEIEVSNIAKAFKMLNNGAFVPNKHFYLYGEINNGTDFDIAVNDIYVCKSNVLGTADLGLYVDGQFVSRFICDGILVSSALGSTAYNRALTGTIVQPNCPVIVITPVGTNDSLFKSLVVSNTSEIVIEVMSGAMDTEILVGFDGTQSVLSMKPKDKITIRNNESLFTVIHLDDFEYYDNLHTKLSKSL